MTSGIDDKLNLEVVYWTDLSSRTHLGFFGDNRGTFGGRTVRERDIARQPGATIQADGEPFSNGKIHNPSSCVAGLLDLESHVPRPTKVGKSKVAVPPS